MGDASERLARLEVEVADQMERLLVEAEALGEPLKGEWWWAVQVVAKRIVIPPPPPPPESAPAEPGPRWRRMGRVTRTDEEIEQ